jgi:hypothetical protein
MEWGWWECGYILNVLCLIICIVRAFGGDSYRVFCSGFPGKFFTRYSAWLFTSAVHLSEGTAIAFFFWVPCEVFHTVLCLIMYIVGTSFKGESYRLFFLGSLGSLNDSRPAGDNVPTGIRTRDRGDLTSLRLAAGRSDYPRFLFWRYSAWLFTSSVPLSQGRAIAFFFRGFLRSFSHGTLPDYLHRPYLFGRGELSRFFFWVSWEVFHTELCLILDSVGFFLWFSMTKWVTGLA